MQRPLLPENSNHFQLCPDKFTKIGFLSLFFYAVRPFSLCSIRSSLVPADLSSSFQLSAPASTARRNMLGYFFRACPRPKVLRMNEARSAPLRALSIDPENRSRTECPAVVDGCLSLACLRPRPATDDPVTRRVSERGASKLYALARGQRQWTSSRP
jgi:hypothetical protein